MLLKDNETIPPIISPDELDPASRPQPFAHEQMVACEHCLRTNPPTRVNCLYCGATLPINETTYNLQKPALRRLEKWEQGYNNILVPQTANAPGSNAEAQEAEAADLLKLTASDFVSILRSGKLLPLARTASLDEATLVQRRLNGLGIETKIVADSDLGVSEAGPFRVRAMEIDEEGFQAFQTREHPPLQIGWQDLILIVTGRLISQRIELKEQKASRAENRILDSSEFFSDETLLEFFVANQPSPYRIASNSFDFSCLGRRKSLVAGENTKTLLELLREKAPQAVVDESYNSLRKMLEPVWPSEQQNESSGWRRERPGKYSIGSVNEKSNEMQFMRYSLLRHYLLLNERTTV